MMQIMTRALMLFYFFTTALTTDDSICMESGKDGDFKVSTTEVSGDEEEERHQH